MGSGVGNFFGDVSGYIVGALEPILKPIMKAGDVIIDPVMEQIGMEGTLESLVKADTWHDGVGGLLGGDDFNNSTGRTQYRSDGTLLHEEKSLVKQVAGMGKNTTADDQRVARNKLNKNKMPWDRGNGLL